MFSYKDITSVQLYGQIFIQIEIGSQRNVAFPSAHDTGSAIVQVRIIETCREFYRVSSNLVGINFQYSLYIPFFASWKTITYKCWHV